MSLNAIFGFLIVVQSGGIVPNPPSEICAASGDQSRAAFHCDPADANNIVPVSGSAPSSILVRTSASVPNSAVNVGRDNVTFPGFNPVEQMLVQAIINVSSIADQLDLAAAGEIDAETASGRIDAARNALVETRTRWRGAASEQRAHARARQRADLERFNARLDQAITAFEISEYRDYAIIQRLRTPPNIADFLREPPIETFTGVYKSGFEASHFYPLEGGTGPWWLEADGDRWETLQSYLVRRPGRGSTVTVMLGVTGWRDTDGGYGHLGVFDTSIYIESIETIRAITPEEFDMIVNRKP
ncbi:MAG: hypothetical protein DHS20C06_18060 [Hyphobacterium sp.]|nr:MAG: hypothetical protein DHS20C06_18060 [Hyphobacterium sp.]